MVLLCRFIDQMFIRWPLSTAEVHSAQPTGRWDLEGGATVLTLDLINKPGETTISRPWMHDFQSADSRNLSSN